MNDDLLTRAEKAMEAAPNNWLGCYIAELVAALRAAEADLATARNVIKWAANTIPCTDHERDILLASVVSTPTTMENEPRMMKGIWPAPAEGRTVALDDASTPTATEHTDG